MSDAYLPSPGFTYRLYRGTGTYTGTVKERGSPANTPLRRRVLLIDDRSGEVLDETWSDATTGVFTFRDIDLSLRFSVNAFDHTGSNWPPVIANNLQATP